MRAIVGLLLYLGAACATVEPARPSKFWSGAHACSVVPDYVACT